MAKTRIELVTDQLRRAVDECGLSRYAIAKATGVDESHLGKFCRGERGLSMEALNAIGRFLDLRITAGRRPGGKKGR